MEKLTREEWETHISIDAVDGHVIIDTSIPKDINNCKKMGYEIITENRYEDGSIINVIFKAPRKAISFRSMESINKPLSEAQLKQRRNAMKNMKKTSEHSQGK